MYVWLCLLLVSCFLLGYVGVLYEMMLILYCVAWKRTGFFLPRGRIVISGG